MKRILIVTPGKLPVPAIKGGAVETLIDMIISENEKDQSFKLDVFSLWDKQIDSINYKSTRFLTVKAPLWVKILDRFYLSYWEKIKKDWRAIFYRNHFRDNLYEKKLIKILQSQSYDRIIVENNMSLLKCIYDTLGENRFSKICDYHMHSALVDNPMMVMYLSKCNQIITVSEFVRNVMLSTYKEFSHVKFTVLRNTVDTSKFQANCLKNRRKIEREKHNIDNDTIVFLYSGRLSIEKGVKELIEAFKRVNSNTCVLVVAGGSYSGEHAVSQYEKEIKKYCEENHLKVEFLGFIDNGEMSNVYALADVLVIPSLAEEAGSLTAIEGMQLQIPMIVSKIGALPEYLGDYPIYVTPGENFTSELTNAMRQYLNDKKSKSSFQARYTKGSRWYFEQFKSIIQ